MEYTKPAITESHFDLPPVTVNFAPPAVGTTNEAIQSYQEEISERISTTFWHFPHFNDKRLSEAAKQI